MKKSNKELAEDFIAYRKTINYLNNLPVWKKELWSYELSPECLKVIYPMIDD